MDFTAIKYAGQGSFKVKKGTIDKLLFFTENHRHLPKASVNDPFQEMLLRHGTLKREHKLDFDEHNHKVYFVISWPIYMNQIV